MSSRCFNGLFVRFSILFCWFGVGLFCRHPRQPGKELVNIQFDVCVLFGVTHRCLKKQISNISCFDWVAFNFNYRFHSILWVLSNATSMFGFHITGSRDNKTEIVSHLSGNLTIESKLHQNLQQLFEFETSSSSSLAHQSTYYRIALCDVESNEQHYFAISFYVCALKIRFGLRRGTAVLVLPLCFFGNSKTGSKPNFAQIRLLLMIRWIIF